MSTTAAAPAHADVVVVGAGFSGLAMAHRLLREGSTDFVVLEKAEEVGGTWRDNSYPGCRCDVPSHLYSLSFALNPDWSSTFSPQPEIYAYLRDVADTQGLRPHVRFGCEVTRSTWNAVDQRWHLDTTQGPMTARVLFTSSGPLSEPSIPQLPGIDRFAGKVFHSARWDHEHDLR